MYFRQKELWLILEILGENVNIPIKDNSGVHDIRTVIRKLIRWIRLKVKTYFEKQIKGDTLIKMNLLMII